MEGAKQRDDIVPGVMNCAKCKFQLVRTNLYMKTGTVGAGSSESEPCPNGCGPLWPVTWKQYAEEYIELSDKEIESLRADNEALRAEKAELVECLDAIVGTYVANRDSESELGGEFIACITPKHASHMTKKERKESRVWSLFDKARALIAKHQTKGVDDGE